MQLRSLTTVPPTGLSFDVSDLLLMQSWADYHDLRMNVELDCCTEDEEYEERVSLFSRSRGCCRWTVWRSRDGIVVQPMVGRRMLFEHLAEGLEHLIPIQD